jgi:hypothetical protein
VQQTCDHLSISGLNPDKDVIVKNTLWLSESKVREAGHKEQCSQERTELRKSNRIDHWIEQLRFNPIKCEQRQLGRYNDERGKEDRTRNLQRRVGGIGYGR